MVAMEDLLEHRAKQVEAGLATFHHMSQQVDDLQRQVANAHDQIARLDTQIESLKEVVSIYESQARHYQRERDQAVADRAVYESLFASFQAMLRAFKIPTTPLVREQSEEEAFAGRLADGLREGLDHVDRAAGHAEYGNGDATS
jgi:chromosome segregation ATPase